MKISGELQAIVMTKGVLDLEKLQEVAFSKVMKPELVEEAYNLLQAELNGGKAFGNIGDILIVQDPKLKELELKMQEKDTIVQQDIQTGAKMEQKFVAGKLVTETEYDNNGRLIYKGHDYNGDKHIDLKSRYEYNNNNRVVYENHSSDDEDLTIFSTYNENNRLHKRSTFEMGEIPLEEEYYPDGKTLKLQTYSLGDLIVEQNEFYQNRKMKSKLEGWYSDESGDKLYEKTFYAPDGKMTKVQRYRNDKEDMTTIKFKYDSDGNLIGENVFDANNKLIEQVKYNDGKIIKSD